MAYNPFLEFVKDRDEYAMARFLSLVKQMQAEGRRPVAVLMAMIRVGVEVAYDERADELEAYLDWLCDHAQEARAKLAKIRADAAEEARTIVMAEIAAEDAARAAKKH